MTVFQLWLAPGGRDVGFSVQATFPPINNQNSHCLSPMSHEMCTKQHPIWSARLEEIDRDMKDVKARIALTEPTDREMLLLLNQQLVELHKIKNMLAAGSSLRTAGWWLWVASQCLLDATSSTLNPGMGPIPSLFAHHRVHSYRAGSKAKGAYEHRSHIQAKHQKRNMQVSRGQRSMHEHEMISREHLRTISEHQRAYRAK
jgi:hypothetical protein